MEYNRISPTTVEIDGEKYIKDYTTDFTYNEPGSIFQKIKSIQDAIWYNTIKNYRNSVDRNKQYNAFMSLSQLADALNEGKDRDENGFRYYVYYDKGEFFICEHTYSIRHVIYFASRKLAQYSILIARKEWENFYNTQ